MTERSKSLWFQTAPSFPPLDADTAADAVVIGAGIAGLMAAYELACRGRSVVVVDRDVIGRGMTAQTSAHLASDMDDGYHALIDAHGEDHSRVVHESQAAAIDRIEAIQTEEGFACAFQRIDGYLGLAEGDEPDLLAREQAACARIGFAGVEQVDHAFFAGPALRFPRQARFHPVQYLDGLADALRRRGARLFAQTCVTAVKENDAGVLVRTETGLNIRAECAVVATNGPINDRTTLHGKMTPYRSYVIAGRVPSGTVEDALLCDTADPYHYVRLHRDGDAEFLVVGGEDHKTGAEDDGEARLSRLEEWARARFPNLGKVAFRWSGQVMEPDDGVPFIGLYPKSKRIYVVTGDSGQGLTFGTVGGMLIADLVAKGASPWAETYDPSRTPRHTLTQTVTQTVSEKLASVASMAGNLIGGDDKDQGEADSEAGIARGHGAVVRSGDDKIAVFRDKAGTLHRCSAVCTHAGCTVKWNGFEQCWDCPCHGSQFAVDGTVLNGPAVAPLEPAEAPARDTKANEKAAS